MPKVKIDYSSKVYTASSKYIQGKKYFEDLYNSGQLPDCNRGFISGYCGCNTYAKNILCGKEYCKDCGREGSPQHQKRFNRWMPKARALKQFGVLVITIPEEIRYKYLNKIRLSDFRTAIKNKLKRLGCERGLMRWHLFGDCVYCEGKSCAKCEHTGAGSDFKPHLNVVIEKGFIKDIHNSELLNDLKNFVTSYWKRAYNKEFIANINYHYSKRLTDKIHQVKYITRSTFRIYDQEIEESLKKYRLTTVWGSFKNIELNSDEKEAVNCCADCNNFIKWQKFEKLSIYNFKYLTNGKFKIISNNPKNPPPKESAGFRATDFVWSASKNALNNSRSAATILQ